MSCRALLRTSQLLVMGVGAVLHDIGPLLLRRQADPDQRRHAIAATIARLFVGLGGVFPKCGQLLGTRFDLFPGSAIEPLRRLHDALPPLDPDVARREIASALGRPVQALFCDFDDRPIAAGTIAQVHRARRRDTGEWVAIKVRRPALEAMISQDLAALRAAGHVAGRLPSCRAYPVEAAIDQVCLAITMQLDFERERRHQRELHQWIGTGRELRIPRVHDDLCAGGVIVMEYIDDLQRIDAATLPEGVHRAALIGALRGLYRMLFRFGRVHCDMHPGNVCVDNTGRAVLVDFGLVVELAPAQVATFRRLFMAIAMGDAQAVAAVLLSTVDSPLTHVDHAVFTADVERVVARSAGRRAGEFRVGTIVSDLFDCLHQQRLRGSADFVLAILSLFVFEGLTTQRSANLDFQREALPFMLAVPSVSS